MSHKSAFVNIVGSPNVGKSTLFNRITGAGVLAEDMLFATLDPTLRRMKLPHGRTVILSDTVGFISDLPTHLVAAFRATLEEVIEADLIVHVRDIAHPETAQQRADVAVALRLVLDVALVEHHAFLVREQALAASRQSQDFGQLSLGSVSSSSWRRCC